MKSLLFFELFFEIISISLAAQACVNQQCSPHVAEADIVFLIDTSATLGNDYFFNIQNFLYGIADDLSLGTGTDKSRLAFITFSQDGTSYGGLDKGADINTVNATIASLKHDNYALRDMGKALKTEETAITNLRSDSKKLLVAIITDTFTGTEPEANGLLDKVRGKYDALLSVALGPQAIQYAYNDIVSFSGVPQDAFFASDAEQLDFARLWIERNACPQYHIPTVPTTPHPPVTQPSGVTCTLHDLTYDIYLIVDTSNVMSSSDFSALKQSVMNFIKQYSIDDGKTQIGLVTVSVDPQRFYTGFHSGQNSHTILTALNVLAQEPTNGQAFNMALSVLDVAYLSSYATDGKTQLVVYFTGNTQFTVDPSANVSKLKNKYGVKFVTVQYTSNADAGALQSISGGSACTIDATDSSKRAQLGATLENLTCAKTFC